MNKHHQQLTPDRWFKLNLTEQMANVGSEIIRSLRWKQERNLPYAALANQRALELLDLTLADVRHGAGLKEIARCRELWLDFFLGENQYHQTADQWKKYFLSFNFAARNRGPGSDDVRYLPPSLD